MTATEYGIVYAVHIITVEFGPIVSVKLKPFSLKKKTFVEDLIA